MFQHNDLIVCHFTMMSRSSVVEIMCSSVGLSMRFFFILIFCIPVVTSLVIVLALTSLFSFIKMLTDSRHAENFMATFSYQEDSVHFPPELTDPALLAEVNHFSFQRFACSSLKKHSQHHLRLFLQQVSQENSLLYFAFCSGGFIQAFSRPESERGDKHLISLFSHSKTGTLEKIKASAGRL